VAEYAQAVGTIVHEYACKRINLNMPLRPIDKDGVLFYLLDRGIPINVIDMGYIYDNLLYYVNDAISYSMKPEVILYYSDNCYGTSDTISFEKNRLRIHDLKTGKNPADIEQLEIYTALFCLEYGKRPAEIDIELRIYQPGNMMVMKPEATDIVPIMDKIVTMDKFLQKLKSEGR
jgi:hypothetical protein